MNFLIILINSSIFRQSRSQEVRTTLIQKIKEKDKPYKDLQQDYNLSIEELNRYKTALQQSQSRTITLENQIKSSELIVDNLKAKVKSEEKRMANLINLVTQFERLSNKVYKNYKVVEDLFSPE